uniref:Elongation factor Ts, mitochondrial n=1 Tax=Synura uvella TaxID=52557 RepID=A0A3G2QZA8_9STRA|nr:elongation factor Ts [Synura uvella]AYO28339.1 elongation factor Ts [Synura uvella]
MNITNITSEQIKALREKTGAGMLNCKNALLENNGDFNKAIEFLRQKGLASAEKKLTRQTKQGIITSYIHTGSKIGVLIELNCETDFVARRIEFQTLARNLAMQIASSNSVNYVSLKDIPQDIWDSELRIESQRDDLQNKPEKIRESILKGRVEKTLKTYTLLNQACIRDPDLTVEEYIKNHVSLLGENIQVGKFTKFILGE